MILPMERPVGEVGDPFSDFRLLRENRVVDGCKLVREDGTRRTCRYPVPWKLKRSKVWLQFRCRFPAAGGMRRRKDMGDILTDEPLAGIGHNQPLLLSDAERAEIWANEVGRHEVILCDLITQFRRIGASYREISKCFGIPLTSLHRWFPATEALAVEFAAELQAHQRAFQMEHGARRESEITALSRARAVPNGTRRPTIG
jgi:hypothetical protein